MKRKIVDIEAPSLLSGGAYAESSVTLDGAIAASLLYQKFVGGIVQSHGPNTGRIFRYKDARMRRLRRQWGSTIPRRSVTGRHPAGLA